MSETTAILSFLGAGAVGVGVGEGVGEGVGVAGGAGGIVKRNEAMPTATMTTTTAIIIARVLRAIGDITPHLRVFIILS
jgi:hypothetical protein